MTKLISLLVIYSLSYVGVSLYYTNDLLHNNYVITLCGLFLSIFFIKDYKRAELFIVNYSLKRGLLMASLMGLFFYFVKIEIINREIIALTIVAGFTSELIISIIYRLSHKVNRTIKKFSLKIPILETFIFSSVFAIGLLLKKLTIEETESQIVIALLFVSLILSHYSNFLFKDFNYNLNYWRNIWSRIKSYLLFIFITLLILSLYPSVPKINIFIFIILYVLISFTINSLRFLTQRKIQTDEVYGKFINITPIEEENYYNYESVSFEKKRKYKSDVLLLELKEKYLKNYPQVFDYLNQAIALNSYDRKKTLILRSSDIYNVEVLTDNSLEFMINLHELNDIRRVNQYLIEVNKKLENNGIYIGILEPIKLKYLKFMNNYPYYLAKLLYFFDFIWRRMMPKLPLTRNIYFAISNGRNRAISMAECLGRLYYCGFEVISTHNIDNFMWFIAVKTGLPKTDKKPSYGPIIKLNRVGKNRKLINVYKFRTMYPYSEYIQKFLYERYGLEVGGKLKNDFRITSWGKVFRKLWIDELPMLLNYLRREIKIVGVRPISQQYFNLYPEELKEKRIKTKPGLVPPFYYDLPKTLNEIIISELKYLDSYFKKPLRTDIKYFFKAFYNIIFRHARSR